MITLFTRSAVHSSKASCWVLDVAGCDLPVCRECSELEKARVAAAWTLEHRAEIASGTLLPGRRK